MLLHTSVWAAQMSSPTYPSWNRREMYIHIGTVECWNTQFAIVDLHRVVNGLPRRQMVPHPWEPVINSGDYPISKVGYGRDCAPLILVAWRLYRTIEFLLVRFTPQFLYVRVGFSWPVHNFFWLTPDLQAKTLLNWTPGFPKCGIPNSPWLSIPQRTFMSWMILGGPLRGKPQGCVLHPHSSRRWLWELRSLWCGAAAAKAIPGASMNKNKSTGRSSCNSH